MSTRSCIARMTEGMDNGDFRQWLRDVATRAYYASSGSPFRCRGLLLVEAIRGRSWPFAFSRRRI